MKFNRIGTLLLILVLIGSIYIVISFGSKNTPYHKQEEYEEVSLTEDPVKQSNPFIFDFPFPSIEIPVISGILGLTGPAIGIIFIIIGIVTSLVLLSLINSYRQKKKEESEEEKRPDVLKDIELKIRRLTLGKRIEEIIAFLEECLDGHFSQGITEGFEKLDSALKEYSKISRPGWLTPREFTLMKIPYFNHNAMISAVEQFYRITYGLKPASQEELEEFIIHFKLMITDENILKWKADSPLEEQN
ncbi:MAG: hypothetical protein ACFFFH_11800 [Candidatus Thorarchaeota archaeon]